MSSTGATVDAVLREDQPVKFDVLRDLQHGVVLEQRLQHGRALRRRRNWPGDEIAAAEEIAGAGARDGRAGCSRRGPAASASETPTRSRLIGSSEVVSVSSATTPGLEGLRRSIDRVVERMIVA